MTNILTHNLPSLEQHLLPLEITEGATIVDLFRLQVQRMGDHPALRRRAGDGWEAISWDDYGHQVTRVAAGLIAAGVQPGERVGVLSANRVEWHVADLAILAAGAVSVPVYWTAAPPQVSYVLGHAGAKVCFVGGHDQLGKVLDHRDELTDLERIVLFEDDRRLGDALISTFAELEASGREQLEREPASVEQRTRAIQPDDLATLVYTSGTTGPPKGTMLSHGNITATIRAVTAVVPISLTDRFLSFLPLSHIAERVVSHFGQIVAGGETWFARSVATVAEDLRDCRPTIFFAVPRVWEKLHEGVLEAMAKEPPVARRLAEHTIALGLERVAEEQDGTSMSPFHKAELLILDRIVGGKIRSGLGLDRARVVVSGAAPIHPSLLRWFHALDVRVAEVYGQTEDCGPATLNPPDRIRIGTVGPPLPGVEVRIAGDGEILVRGGTVCQGYYRNDEATAELIDADRWMHTGDVGVLDPDGYLSITDRKKDLIITASGKNVSPQEIETRVKLEPLISQAVVIGDQRPYLVALLTLAPDAATTWAAEHHRLADLEALASDPDLLGEIEASIDRVNADHARTEGIKKWRVLPHDLTIAGDELTPTLKVRRRTVLEHYQDLIEEMYAS